MRRTVAIARQEVQRLLGPRAGRTVGVVVLMGLLLGGSVILMQERLPSPEESLHSYAAAPGSPYMDALAADARFRQVPGGRADVAAGEISLWADDGLEAAPGARGDAALSAARETIRRWTELQMEHEKDQEAAFPLSVRLVSRPAAPSPSPTLPSPAAAPDAAPSATDTASTRTPGTTDPDPRPTNATPEPEEDRLRPHELQVPGPGLSLVVTFAFMVPMNIVGQVCSSGLLQERTRRRGLLTLTAPIHPAAVLGARMVPYAVLSLVVALVAGLVARTGLAGFAAAVVIVALPLAVSAVLGLLARSERELTFLLTAAMTLYAFFLFLPAVFRALPPIAFLSPLTVVLESAEGTHVTAGQFLYATVPGLLAAGGLGLLAAASYRDETLHGPMRLGEKVAQATGRIARSVPGAVLAGALLVPFAFALEMMAVAFLLPLGLAFLFPGFLVAVAVVEEGLKRIPIAARLAGGARSVTTAAAVATGFFIGEKLALLVAWAGLGELEMGLAVLGVFGVGTVALLAIPLAVHFVTALIQSRGLRSSRRAVRAATLGAAIMLHLAYDAAVLVYGGVA